MKKARVIALVLALAMFLGLIPAVSVSAADQVASGTCGENLTWVLTEDGTLTISGIGDMADYTSDYSNSPTFSTHPWKNVASQIQRVVLENGVTSIGDYAFISCKNLKQITICEGVTSIGYWAFYNCGQLEELTFPASVTTVSSVAFLNCMGLKKITFQGSVPTLTHPMAVGIFDQTSADIYYPAEDESWWGQAVRQKFGVALNWIPVGSQCQHPETEIINFKQPFCDTEGYSGDVACFVCGEILSSGETLPMVDHRWSTVQGYVMCMTCGRGGHDSDYTAQNIFAGMTMTLGNSLAVNFVVDTAYLVGNDHYAVITKTYADQTEDVTLTIPQSQWQVYSKKQYYFTFTGINAKEMTDRFTVRIYNAAGEQVSVTYSRTIADYCYGLLTKEAIKAEPDPVRLALYTDILNYGAAAQDFFGYHTNNPANGRLTAAQRAYATQNVPLEDIRTEGEGYMGSTLSLKNEILMNFVFTNEVLDNTAYAVYTFQHHDGGEEQITVPIANCRAYGSTGKYLDVKGMKVADCGQVITVTLYDADGNVLSTSTDSVWSYASRNTAKHAVYTAVLKLADSAYKYFH